MRLVFMGTPEFAVPSLEALVSAGFDVSGVFTRPDKPRGRGLKTLCSPVAEAAEKAGIPVFKPAGFKDSSAGDTLRSLLPDAVAVVAYGRILPPAVLGIPRLGCVNAHASLLPAYRGAAPIQWSVVRGETVTGVTTMHMSSGLDEGDMIYSEPVEIATFDTAGVLHDRLKLVAARLLARTLSDLGKGTAPRTPQRAELASYAPIIKKEDGYIDWSKTPSEVVNLVRGMNPWPLAYTTIDNVYLRVYEAADADTGVSAADGTVLASNPKDGLVIASGGGAVRILTLQPAGGKVMSASDYLRGRPFTPGSVAGGKS
ncbi:methionyl-tRNA formyltransferase [Clostridia bacterium]|nr:methionyl-tRNA formyltransferase [Clostridia bacterium]